MSKVTAALEQAVAIVLENTPTDGAKPTARQRHNTDQAFARILKLIAPRIRHFVRQYGLVAHWDDAEQCCAIAVHRAIQAYEPDKAQFTTFVNWQIRGELQSLRFRLMTDQRPSAKKVEATTVSLHAVAVGAEGEETTLESMIVDEDALEHTEAAASAYLANAATERLLDELTRTSRIAALELMRRQQPKRALARIQQDGPRFRNLETGLDPIEVHKLDLKLARERDILEKRVFGDGQPEDAAALDPTMTKDRVRQIGKRGAKAMADLAATKPEFQIMAEYAGTAGKAKAAAAAGNVVAFPAAAEATRRPALRRAQAA